MSDLARLRRLARMPSLPEGAPVKTTDVYIVLDQSGSMDGPKTITARKMVYEDKGEYRQGSRAVRSLLGLPETGKIRIKPAEHAGQYDLFVQSTSNNRKMVEGQVLLTIPA